MQRKQKESKKERRRRKKEKKERREEELQVLSRLKNAIVYNHLLPFIRVGL